MLDIAIIQGNQSKQYFKDAENKSSMNTNNWDQHQIRLNKSVESRQKSTFFYQGPRAGFYYIIYRRKKVYC